MNQIVQREKSLMNDHAISKEDNIKKEKVIEDLKIVNDDLNLKNKNLGDSINDLNELINQLEETKLNLTISQNENLELKSEIKE